MEIKMIVVKDGKERVTELVPKDNTNEETRMWKDRYSSLYASTQTGKPMSIAEKEIFRQWYSEMVSYSRGWDAALKEAKEDLLDISDAEAEAWDNECDEEKT